MGNMRDVMLRRQVRTHSALGKETDVVCPGDDISIIGMSITNGGVIVPDNQSPR